MAADSHDLGLEERWSLVAPHRDQLVAVAWRRCPNRQDAEDCAHEAMVRAVAYPDLDPARVGALLTTMVLRISADLARRRGVEQRGCPRMALLPGQAAPPDEAVTDRDEARWLGEQLSRLSERERQVFERRAAGLSAAETAHVLQLSYKAVESAFTRARHRLRLWAVTGAVLFGDLLRRLRQRPGVLTAAVLAVSAGCLIASGPGTHSPRLGAGATRNRAPLASWFSLAPRPAPNDGLGSEVRSWPAATGRGRAAPGEPGPSGASTGPAPTPTPTVEVRTPPVDGPGGNPIIGSTGLTSDLSGDPVYHYEYCLAHPALGPDTYGCPPT